MKHNVDQQTRKVFQQVLGELKRLTNERNAWEKSYTQQKASTDWWRNLAKRNEGFSWPDFCIGVLVGTAIVGLLFFARGGVHV